MKRLALLLLATVLCVSPIRSVGDVAERRSTAADHQSLNLTVYNNNLALVHDQRRIRLEQGMSRIAWRDISANMDATSALLDSSASTDRVDVLEQDFNYDVLSEASLMAKFVGHYVTVVHPETLHTAASKERARILSAGDNIILQYANRIETSVRGYIEYPGVPSTLRDVPTLDLDLQSANAGVHPLDLSYLTGGLSWEANYVGTLSADDTRLDLNGLVTLTNDSGTSFTNARLQLVAGNVNAPQPSRMVLKTIARVSSQAYSSVVGASQEDYFQYHLYTFARRTTILDKQSKQLSLLSAHDIPVRETLELRGETYYYRQSDPDLGDRLPIGVYVSFDNKGGDLGIPLPAGGVRIYKNDSHGLSQWVGSDRIQHTPKGDTVRLYLGDAFDVVARKRQTDFQLVSDCETTSGYAVDLINGKDAAQTVQVIEPMPADWSITSESQKHVKSSAATATWTVAVPADGKATLAYTAHVRWCR